VRHRAIKITPTADIRIGYARCSTLRQELQPQLDALEAHGIPRDKIFSEKISTRLKVRPRFEAALAAAREIKAHAPHCRVIFTVYEMKRPGATAPNSPPPPTTSPTTASPWRCSPDPSPASTTRPDTAASCSRSSPPWPRLSATASAKEPSKGSTHDMLHTVLRRQAAGEKVEAIQPDLIIPSGKRRGQSPSVASIYRALAAHTKAQAHPDAVAEAHTEFAALSAGGR